MAAKAQHRATLQNRLLPQLQAKLVHQRRHPGHQLHQHPVPAFPDISEALNAGFTTQQVIDYYMEVAFGFEHRTKPSDKVRKWEGAIRIYVHGATEYDLNIIDGLIDELSDLTSQDISRLNEDGTENMTIRFIPNAEFPLQNAAGYTSPNFDSPTLKTCSIGIAADNSDMYRSVALREELLQCTTGLFNDSYAYEDSVFYDQFLPLHTSFPPIDLALIRLQSSGSIQAGMTKQQVEYLFIQIADN